jgi:hypothetical protein
MASRFPGRGALVCKPHAAGLPRLDVARRYGELTPVVLPPYETHREADA